MKNIMSDNISKNKFRQHQLNLFAGQCNLKAPHIRKSFVLFEGSVTTQHTRPHFKMPHFVNLNKVNIGEDTFLDFANISCERFKIILTFKMYSIYFFFFCMHSFLLD